MKRTRYAGDISDEEITHYLAKKAMKKAMKLAKKLKPKTAIDGSYNHWNPFGDSNLNEQFVWKKKIERDVTLGVPLDMFSGNAQKKRMKERMAEIVKVKKRREERAVEKAQHEEEMALLARERARAEFQDWEKKEEEFHFTQSKIRSEIRCHEGRMKAIDILKEHINPSHGFDIEKEEPYMVFKRLTVKELEELHEDIKMYQEFDRETQTHIQYWEALLVVCDWELDELCKKDTLDRARVRGERPPLEVRGLHPSIEVEVKKCLDGKSFAALERIQSEIESKMLKSADVVEYWEAVYKRLPIYKAKACLNEVHKNMLCQHFTPRPFESYGDKERDKTLSPKVEEDSGPMVEEEEAGSFSPELLHGDESEEAIDPKDDRAILEKKRMQVLEEQQKVFEEAMVVQSPRPMDDFETRAVKSMGVMDNGDRAFGHRDEVNVDSQVYWWHDKYRPRKPKYFNRVHTGYEWNKYNQTHYDHDNPPPKTVHGYKFNIFYPDLIDSTKAPTYTIKKDDDSAETCIIRFHAGPPYEDIAFRIVNKEWEYSHKKGFKCMFERGLLHVYFNFKRYRYRR